MNDDENSFRPWKGTRPQARAFVAEDKAKAMFRGEPAQNDPRFVSFDGIQVWRHVPGDKTVSMSEADYQKLCGWWENAEKSAVRAEARIKALREALRDADEIACAHRRGATGEMQAVLQAALAADDEAAK